MSINLCVCVCLCVCVDYADCSVTCFAASLGRMNMEAEDSIATIDSILMKESEERLKVER